MTHPYQDLPARAFWRSGVAEADPFALHGIYEPKVQLTPLTGIATAGSCFAQHVGRALRAAGVAVLDAEPPPFPMRDETAMRFGYGLFSGRYGNVYTVRQLVQLLEDAISGRVERRDIWERGGRFYDALRPNVEPDGLDSPEEALALRRDHLRRLRTMLAGAEVFIFTLGLTESWRDRETGRIFPTCPGVIAGTFDPAVHVFHNFTLAEVLEDLGRARALLQQIRPGMAMILTVSPVPLTATAAGGHVLTATAQSKAVLRAAAGVFAEAQGEVDYFPSFEIVTNPAAGGAFFAPNLRTVRPEGVAAVMRVFLEAQGLAAAAPGPRAAPGALAEEAGEEGGEDAVICEELLLDAFRK